MKADAGSTVVPVAMAVADARVLAGALHSEGVDVPEAIADPGPDSGRAEGALAVPVDRAAPVPLDSAGIPPRHRLAADAAPAGMTVVTALRSR